jgi:uncharacterized protein YcaQ
MSTGGVTRLSLARARRIALAAQGFGRPRGFKPPTTRQLTALVQRLGILQLDSVNVFCRSHYMPAFSRLGPYDRALLDRIAGHGAGPIERRLIEYWAHEASLIPVELHPLLRWRMADVDRQAWGSIGRVIREQPELVARTLALVDRDGPIRARATAALTPPADTQAAAVLTGSAQMWNWHPGKVALEYLFFSGRIAAARRVNFERHYDLSERVLPAAVSSTPTPPVADAQRELIRVAARAHGVATGPDLSDYFRMPSAASKARVAELVASGELIPVEVESWDAAAFGWHEARQPRSLNCRALLTPFDSLVWFRPRTERLFGFRYRIEIYTPAAKRIHGYYVLPFLLGEDLVARVDLKSDRQRGALMVQSAFIEPGADPELVAAELAAELRLTAAWLGLDQVLVAGRGDLAAGLAGALLS